MTGGGWQMGWSEGRGGGVETEVGAITTEPASPGISADG